jgi:hypothetical protein
VIKVATLLHARVLVLHASGRRVEAWIFGILDRSSVRPCSVNSITYGLDEIGKNYEEI